MNVVALVGNLASDVELREFGDEKRLATFRLAVDRHSAEGGADFFAVAAWGRQAESCARFLAKGSPVAVDGRLRSRSWEDPDGKRRSAVEVVANRVQFLATDRGAAAETPFAEVVAA